MTKRQFKPMSLVSLLALSGLGLAQRGTAGYTAQVNAGQRALGAKKYTEAAEHFRYALVFNQGGVDAHNGLGEVYLKIGKKQRALEQFAEVLHLSPHSSEAERGIHEARTEGQEAKSFQDLEAAIAQNPKSADLQTTYAEELIERGRYDEGQKHAEIALKLDGRQWHAYCAMGRIAAHKDQADIARQDLQLAVKHDYTDDDALETLGNLEFEAGNLEQAEVWFKRLTELLPDEADGHELLGKVYSAMGKEADAQKENAIATKIKANTEGK